MTRARALKQAIRARAAKTGERYTTARRHILRELNSPVSPVSPVSPTSVKGGLSDAKALEKTGHDLVHWFNVLDRFGAIEKGHTAAAAFLYEEYKVPGWYCQGIVVAYEVTAVESYAKRRLPYEEVFGIEPEPALRLITCGGAFDRKAGDYTENLVIFANYTGHRDATEKDRDRPLYGRDHFQ